MWNSYIQKFIFTIKVSRNISTFVKFIYNTIQFHLLYKYNNKNEQENNSNNYQIKINKKNYNIAMRTSKGDLAIFYEIFWKQIYFIPFQISNKNINILDLGAHIGLSSLYFNIHYPNAYIYSVEASQDNFLILKDNLKFDSRNTPLPYAIYDIDREILFNEKGHSYNYQVDIVGNPIQAISVNTIMNKYNIAKFNLVKIDIEGAENILLKNNNNWLAYTDNIIIEIHPPYNFEQLTSDLKPFGFTIILPDLENKQKNIIATKYNV